MIALEPTPTSSSGAARRARSTDTFHSGSRSGAQINSNTGAIGAWTTTLERSLSVTSSGGPDYIAPRSGADGASTLDLKSAMMRSVSAWSISSTYPQATTAIA